MMAVLFLLSSGVRSVHFPLPRDCRVLRIVVGLVLGIHYARTLSTVAGGNGRLAKQLYLTPGGSREPASGGPTLGDTA